MPIDRPIFPEDVLSNLDAARPMLEYLSDANLLNPTSFMEAKELFNFINNLDLNLDFRGGFYPRFGNILNNLSEFTPKVDYTDLRGMFPADFNPSGLIPDNLLQCSEEEFRSNMERAFEESRNVFDSDSRTRDLNRDLGEGPSNYQDLNVPEEDEVDKPYEGKGKGKAK